MAWLKESWGYLLLIVGLIATGFKLLQTTYAAERDRLALKNAELEREKLALEVGRLRNDPKVVEDRRAIYERLRVIMAEITRDGAATRTQINDLHGVWHDAEFRFPPDVIASIKGFIDADVGLHVTGIVIKDGPGRCTPEDWSKYVQNNHDASMAILAFDEKMA